MENLKNFSGIFLLIRQLPKRKKESTNSILKIT